MLRLTMNERYILYPLLRFGEHTPESLLTALESLEGSVNDRFLKLDVQGLTRKLRPSLNQEMLNQLKQDAHSGVLCGPEVYRLEELDEDDSEI